MPLKASPATGEARAAGRGESDYMGTASIYDELLTRDDPTVLSAGCGPQYLGIAAPSRDRVE